MVSTSEAIAYAEICVYIPTFILTLFVVFRHGFKRQAGWIYLAIFSLIRVAGAGFKIAQSHNPTNKTDIEWAAILQSVGLSPLLLASMGLLKRVNVAANSGIANIITKRATAHSRRSRVIQIAALPTMIALALAIIGGTDEADSDASDISNGKKYMKIAVIMFFCIYLLLCALTVITMTDVGNAPRGEKRIYIAVLAALPLLAVRLLYSILAAFVNNNDFSIFGGKPLIQLFMAIIEEFVIVLFYTLVGLTSNKSEY
ncbi:uncharacterized protein LY89DRAFT_582774 [Mollisia scopiformis]|uniref:DUF7702 domain-containing protein n=1 Tax=Mollisia scopiformis TaxID=149040 RepID=A0A194XFK1_MOLSC|nr:uncharacterized protein LY89DRAFT_582774 [Mollisia scopiformis]KUJ18921.1 hypothetical protein LY89DRAFT_582774 [Mollisia scopiformis]